MLNNAVTGIDSYLGVDFSRIKKHPGGRNLAQSLQVKSRLKNQGVFLTLQNSASSFHKTTTTPSEASFHKKRVGQATFGGTSLTRDLEKAQAVMRKCDTYHEESLESKLSPVRDIDLYKATESYRNERLADSLNTLEKINKFPAVKQTPMFNYNTSKLWEER